MVKEYKYKNHLIRILNDDGDVESPREDDPLGKMVCFHRRYNLGDEYDYKVSDFTGWDELEQHLIKKEKAVVILPIYMYEHSDITIKTTPFSCSFDSGQVGFIYTTRDMYLKRRNFKRLTKKLKEEARQILEGEVEMYDQWLRGEFYGYVIDPEDSEDTCGIHDEYAGGFDDVEGAEMDAKAAVDRLSALDEELDLIKNLPVAELPKYINHKWKFPYVAEPAFKERFKTLDKEESCPTQ